MLDECFRDTSKYYFMKDLVAAVNRMLRGKDLQPVSKRTVQKDIAHMRSTDGWEIELREDLKGGKSGREMIYRYQDPTFSIYNEDLTPEEKKQLRNTIGMLRRFKGLPNWENLEQVLVWLQVKFHLDGMDEGTVMFAQNPYLKGLGLFGELLDAVIGKRMIDIVYAPYGRKKKVRQGHPYQLRQWNHRWYLIGLEERLRPRIPYAVIPIDRIEKVKKVYGEGFKAKEDGDFDFDEYFEDIVGVSLLPEGKVVPVVAKVGYPNVWYLETKPLHASQRVVGETPSPDGTPPKQGENYKVFRWDVIPNEELIQGLMVYADQIEILEPEWVAQKLRERAKKILEKNGVF